VDEVVLELALTRELLVVPGRGCDRAFKLVAQRQFHRTYSNRYVVLEVRADPAPRPASKALYGRSVIRSPSSSPPATIGAPSGTRPN